MSDWESEYFRGLSDGTGTGIGGLLADQENRRREWEREAAARRREDRLARKTQAATTTVETNSTSETQVDIAEPIFPKFIAYASYPLLVIGLVVGFMLSAGFAGYWPLLGAAVGAWAGFSVPRAIYLLTMWLMLVLLEVLEFLLDLLGAIIKIAISASVLIGAYFAYQYFVG